MAIPGFAAALRKAATALVFHPRDDIIDTLVTNHHSNSSHEPRSAHSCQARRLTYCLLGSRWPFIFNRLACLFLLASLFLSYLWTRTLHAGCRSSAARERAGGDGFTRKSKRRKIYRARCTLSAQRAGGRLRLLGGTTTFEQHRRRQQMETWRRYFSTAAREQTLALDVVPCCGNAGLAARPTSTPGKGALFARRDVSVRPRSIPRGCSLLVDPTSP